MEGLVKLKKYIYLHGVYSYGLSFNSTQQVILALLQAKEHQINF